MPAEDPSRIERVPWSELGPEWIELWGGAPQPEHIEIAGQNGSGKTYFFNTALQQRARVFDDREILVATKPADETLDALGWPITDRWEDVRAYRQVLFWPQTDKIGAERKRHHEERIYDLLARLWVPHSDCVLGFDEIGYLEKLSARLREMVEMYWREARSNGITMGALKQRPVKVLREQHSETRWKAVFPPADRGDMRRFAELLGSPKEWEPVLDDLGPREFVLHYSGEREDLDTKSFITWIDTPLRPIPAQANQKRQSPLPTHRKDKNR